MIDTIKNETHASILLRCFTSPRFYFARPCLFHSIRLRLCPPASPIHPSIHHDPSATTHHHINSHQAHPSRWATSLGAPVRWRPQHALTNTGRTPRNDRCCGLGGRWGFRTDCDLAPATPRPRRVPSRTQPSKLLTTPTHCSLRDPFSQTALSSLCDRTLRHLRPSDDAASNG